MGFEPKWRKYWPAFETVMKARLQRGHEEYGDGSFSRDTAALLGEIEQELLDVVGWAFITWVQVMELRQRHEVPKP